MQRKLVCRRTTADLSTPFHYAQDDNCVSVSVSERMKKPVPSCYLSRPVNMVIVLLGVSQKRVIICKFPQKYLFLTGGWYFSPSDLGCPGSTGLGLSCIYRALVGVNYLQSGRIYFEVLECELRAPEFHAIPGLKIETWGTPISATIRLRPGCARSSRHYRDERVFGRSRGAITMGPCRTV